MPTPLKFTGLTLAQAERIVDTAIATARELRCEPVTVAVLDAAGQLKALKREDGCPFIIVPVAQGKAWTVVATGRPSGVFGEFIAKFPALGPAFTSASEGRFMPMPGGVLIASTNGEVLGAVGVSGAMPEDDVHCAQAGIRAAGLLPVPG